MIIGTTTGTTIMEKVIMEVNKKGSDETLPFNLLNTSKLPSFHL